MRASSPPPPPPPPPRARPAARRAAWSSPSRKACAASALGLSPPGAAARTRAGGRGTDGGGADGRRGDGGAREGARSDYERWWRRSAAAPLRGGAQGERDPVRASRCPARDCKPAGGRRRRRRSEVAAGNFSAADREHNGAVALAAARGDASTRPSRRASRAHPMLLGSGVDVESEPPSPTGDAQGRRGGRRSNQPSRRGREAESHKRTRYRAAARRPQGRGVVLPLRHATASRRSTRARE